MRETTVGSPGRVAPGAVSSDSAAAGPRAFSDTPALRCAEWGLEAFQVPSPRLPAELWVGKEGRAGSAAGPAHSSGWEPVGRVLEAPCPSGAHRGLCLVWGEQETPHPGEKPSQPQGGPGHHFLCRWTHPGWFASGSWWGGGSGYREAGSSLPQLPALSYRTHCRGGGSIVGMAVWWQRADKTVPVGFTQPPDSSQCQLDPRRPAVHRPGGWEALSPRFPFHV